MIIVLTGVSGAGKTAVGSALAGDLGWRFIDGDDYHSSSSIEKMRIGTPLDDTDREPWLKSLRGVLIDLDSRSEDAVLACSALRRSFRQRLVEGIDSARLVHLTAPAELVLERLRSRRGHFAGQELLPSQLVSHEPGDDLIVVRNEAAIPEVVRAIREELAV